MNSISEGDVDQQTTFAAVGQTLTAWELCEDALSALYSVLEEQSGEIEAYQRYGLEGRSLSYRLKIISKSGFTYFAKRPDQENEGSLASILETMERLSPLRHQIAHGMVGPVVHCGEDELEGVERYHLGAPWFAEDRLSVGFPGYDSKAMFEISKRFQVLQASIEEFVERLVEF